jgi:hypothetical protein
MSLHQWFARTAVGKASELLSPAISILLASAALWPHVEVVFTHGTFEPPGIGPIGRRSKMLRACNLVWAAA